MFREIIYNKINSVFVEAIIILLEFSFIFKVTELICVVGIISAIGLWLSRWMIQPAHLEPLNKICRWSRNSPLYRLSYGLLSVSFDAEIPKKMQEKNSLAKKKLIRTFELHTQTWKMTPMPTITCTNNEKIINVALMMNVFSSELYVIRNRSWFAFAVNKAISIMPTSRSFESNQTQYLFFMSSFYNISADFVRVCFSIFEILISY